MGARYVAAGAGTCTCVSRRSVVIKQRPSQWDGPWRIAWLKNSASRLEKITQQLPLLPQQLPHSKRARSKQQRYQRSTCAQRSTRVPRHSSIQP